jgi:alpha-1,2-mannosyltransferase
VSLSVGKVDKAALDRKFKEGRQEDRRVIYGFFHLYANAGGGGERVLWAAVKQTLANSPNHVCAIYTGLEPSVTTGDIFERVERRFGLTVDRERVVFIFVSQRRLVDPASWPRFTILGQAIGSLVVAYEAITHLVPDVWVDTMGQPFSYPLISWILNIPICAYVHYPVVSSDMLAKVTRFSIKWWYWKAMQLAYTWAGSYATIVAANSSWTQNHIQDIWWLGHKRERIQVLYPPCATQDFNPDFEKPRQPVIVCIAQFRPEKRHELLLREFAKFLKDFDETKDNKTPSKPHLMLIGSVRNDQDSSRIYSLRLLARELELNDDYVSFLLDAPWSQVSAILQLASFGVNPMWNEHFGMVFVEYMAAGLIPIAHNSAGPKLDIIKDEKGRPGFLFTSDTDPDYNSNEKSPSLSECFTQAFSMSPETEKDYRKRSATIAGQFSDEAFADGWDKKVELLKKLELMRRKSRLIRRSFD